MKIDLTWKKVSAGVGGFIAICTAVWQISIAIHKIGNFIDTVFESQNKIVELENKLKSMYTVQELQFLLKYNLSQPKE